MCALLLRTASVLYCGLYIYVHILVNWLSWCSRMLKCNIRALTYMLRLRHYAKNRKVACSVPDVIGFFQFT
jgi:hypothetical protein